MSLDAAGWLQLISCRFKGKESILEIFADFTTVNLRIFLSRIIMVNTREQGAQKAEHETSDYPFRNINHSVSIIITIFPSYEYYYTYILSHTI